MPTHTAEPQAVVQNGLSASTGVQPAEGSSLYYSLWHCAAAQRRQVMARLEMIETLSHTLLDVRDPAVASRKVHWWHEEIDRLIDGEPRHPASIAMSGTLPTSQTERDAIRSACLQVLSTAADEHLDPAQALTLWNTRLQQDFRARLALLAHALTGNAGDLASGLVALNAPPTHAGQSTAALDRLALAFGRMERLLHLPRLLHRGYLVFAHEALAAHGLSADKLAARVRRAPPGECGDAQEALPASLVGAGSPADARDDDGVDPETADTIARFLQAQVTETQRCFAWARDPAAARKPLPAVPLPITIMARMRERQCQLWQRRQPDLIRERQSLTPLTKLWIAWRTRQQAPRC